MSPYGGLYEALDLLGYDFLLFLDALSALSTDFFDLASSLSLDFLDLASFGGFAYFYFDLLFDDFLSLITIQITDYNYLFNFQIVLKSKSK